LTQAAFFARHHFNRGVGMTDENKNEQHDKGTILSIIKYTLIAGIVALVLFFGLKVFFLLIPVVIGFVLAYLSNKFSVLMYRVFLRKAPMISDMEPDRKGYRIFKLINYTFFLLCFIGIAVLLVFALISQIRNLLYFFDTSVPTTEIVSTITRWLNNLSQELGGFLPESTIKTISDEMVKIQADLLEAIPRWTTAALNSILSFITNIPSLIFQIIAVIMSGYYFISDRMLVGKFIAELLPSEVFVSKVTSVISKVSNSLFRYFGGYAIILSITFIESFIGLSILKMPYAVVIALIVTVIDILPAVGASACFFPIAIYMFTQGRVVDGIIALVFVALMMLVRTALEPKIIGTAMKLHPLVTLIAMIIGVFFLGVGGFLGGPILLIFILGIMDSFGFGKLFKDWLRKILNKVATVDKRDIVCVPATAKVKHIVAWQLKDNPGSMTKEAFIEEMKTKLLSLPEVIPQIASIEFGTDTKFDETAYDCVLIATFASYEDLSTYKNHPAHKEVSHWVRQNISSRTVVDFDL
jgi:sporulation integral membrane protein YtvI